MVFYKYCPLCGSELVGIYELGKSYPKCPTEHFTYYPSQIVGVAGFILKQRKILLERRAGNTGYGLWALPGGMAESGEEMEECLKREVEEETGITIENIKFFKIIGGKKICVVFYEAEWLTGELIKSEESLELAWFSVEDIPFEEFAFPRQREVLEHWIRVCR